MKLVPGLSTPDGAERVDNIIITTDKNGENPVVIKYVKDGEEKELHLKPEITLCLMTHSVVISNIAALMVFCILNDTLKPKYFSFKIEFQGRKDISKKFDSIYTKCRDRVFCFEQYTEKIF